MRSAFTARHNSTLQQEERMSFDPHVPESVSGMLAPQRQTASPSQQREQSAHPLRLPAHYLAVRRVVEIVLILVTLPATIVLALVIALAIRVDSPGPVFFRQERIGRYGRRFRILKFRSMYDSAEPSTTLTTEHDARITRVGRMLRLHHLDELPQLWNVLSGEMSLVGPRPEPAFVSETIERSVPLYICRRIVPPGMTGLAQVRQGYVDDLSGAQIRHRLAYDLLYIRRLSPRLDLAILFRTVPVLLWPFRAR
jgi:lipopolysaccharide/colanic/teichoic acid biosynthesis glycosyltransferase